MTLIELEAWEVTGNRFDWHAHMFAHTAQWQSMASPAVASSFSDARWNVKVTPLFKVYAAHRSTFKKKHCRQTSTDRLFCSVCTHWSTTTSEGNRGQRWKTGAGKREDIKSEQSHKLICAGEKSSPVSCTLNRTWAKAKTTTTIFPKLEPFVKCARRGYLLLFFRQVAWSETQRRKGTVQLFGQCSSRNNEKLRESQRIKSKPGSALAATVPPDN